MRKLTFSMLTSLDGYVDGPNGQDWVIADDELHAFAAAQFRSADMLLFGRVTYELFVGYWPTAAADPASTAGMIDFANAINDERLGKIVCSRTLSTAAWGPQPVRLIRELTPADILDLKQKSGKNIVIAGASIGSALARWGLVDEVEQLVHPVVLGSGKPMFSSLLAPIQLKLLRTHTFGSGVVVLTYQPVVRSAASFTAE